MDDLIERLEFVARGLDSQWDKEIADIMMEAAAEIRNLRAEREAAQRQRMQARFEGRAKTSATADFDLPSSNDAITSGEWDAAKALEETENG